MTAVLGFLTPPRQSVANSAHDLHRNRPMLTHIAEQRGFPGQRGPRRVTTVPATPPTAVTPVAPARPLYPVLVFHHDQPIEEVRDFGGRPFARTPMGWALIDDADVCCWTLDG